MAVSSRMGSSEFEHLNDKQPAVELVLVVVEQKCGTGLSLPSSTQIKTHVSSVLSYQSVFYPNAGWLQFCPTSAVDGPGTRLNLVQSFLFLGTDYTLSLEYYFIDKY